MLRAVTIELAIILMKKIKGFTFLCKFSVHSRIEMKITEISHVFPALHTHSTPHY